LNRRANQLARILVARGVVPDRTVGICLERQPEMIIGLLAILKAGGAYVPLDMSYPQDRLALMIADAEVSVLVTRRSLLSELPEHNADVVCLDTDRDEITRQSQENPAAGATAENLAYVMYTSGSTGKPKGVAVPHRAVLRLLVNVSYVHLDARETLLQMAPISFDASTFEIWGALLHGGRCVLFPGQVPSTHELGQVLARHGVTTLWLTSSLFNVVIDEAPEVLSEVKQLLIGGEALSVPHVRRALDRLPSTQIINGYGPTESTTFACCHAIPNPLDDNLRSIPIGRPIANTQVYIVDPNLQPVPVGVPGELLIGGDGLARDYLNDAELTKRKFIPHPLEDRPGSRVFRTGDRVRYLADGSIEFLGRFDDQVKLRGFRIELGEIEWALGQHPGMNDVVVMLREDELGEKSLVAYVVAAAGANPTGGDLRTFLAEKLPAYMIPSTIVQMDAIPLSPNGKVDREALPAPDEGRSELADAYVAPESPDEVVLAGIWREVLGVRRIGVHDNFFELGGHSLKLTQVLSRLRSTLKVDLALRELFEEPTIAGVASLIDVMRAGGSEQRTTAISPLSRQPRRAWRSPGAASSASGAAGSDESPRKRDEEG
jgi:amino acid adenylation domain-containing protein